MFVVIAGRVAVEVSADFPGAWYHCGAWYVWDRDYPRS